jgi:aminoglycoside phosphotransferase (APT) family kinase protein
MFAVFPFVEGRRPERTLAVAEELGRAVAELHAATLVLADALPPRERFDIRYDRELPRLLDQLAALDSGDAALQTLRAHIEPVSRDIVAALERLGQLRHTAAGGLWVICHRDLGPHNILADSSGALVFIDWDEVALAPPEHDLICGCNAWYQSRHAQGGPPLPAGDDGGRWFQAFLAAYAGSGGGGLDFDRFAFAFLRRLLDDIFFRLRAALDPATLAEDRRHGVEVLEKWILPVFHRADRTLAEAAAALAAIGSR